ncbi:MAG: AEC family transporter [Spirochaetales bacterium]|nr:MAG: AEC family transporter [Spirochaetales bacterium]
MNTLPPSVTQSLILFFLMAAGFVAGKAGILRGEAVRGLSRFLLDFTLPALIIVSMQRPFTPDLRDQALRVLGLSVLVYAASFPLAFAFTALYRRAPIAEKGVHRFAMCFSNVGFMGFPVAESVLGRESLFMVSIYNIPFQVLAFSVGVALVRATRDGSSENPNGRRSILSLSSLKALLNPAILAALVGFALFLFSVRIPEPLFSSLELLGGTTTPLAMAIIGAVLAGTKLGGLLGNPRLWITTGYRLALHPFLVFLLAKALGLTGLELAVPVLIAAMPVAANTTILAGVYGGDAVNASGLVFVSTVLSLATIPLLANLLGH